jgi:ferredoxin
MANIIHYRGKCIGCGICYEQQPELWRMSKKDGKATLIKAAEKKQVFVLPINSLQLQQTQDVARACPVNIIKVV